MDLSMASKNVASGKKKKSIVEPEYFVVETIRDWRMNETHTAREFLVHWDGYDSSDDSWEPETGLNMASEALEAFLTSKDLPRKFKKAKTRKSKKRSSSIVPTPPAVDHEVPSTSNKKRPKVLAPSRSISPYQRRSVRLQPKFFDGQYQQLGPNKSRVITSYSINVVEREVQPALIERTEEGQTVSSAQRQGTSFVEAEQMNDDEQLPFQEHAPPIRFDAVEIDGTTGAKLITLGTQTLGLHVFRLAEKFFFVSPNNATIKIMQLPTTNALIITSDGCANLKWSHLDEEQFMAAIYGKVHEFYFESPREKAGIEMQPYVSPPNEDLKELANGFSLNDYYVHCLFEQIADDLKMKFNSIPNHGFSLISDEGYKYSFTHDGDDQILFELRDDTDDVADQTTWRRLDFSMFAYAVRGRIVEGIMEDESAEEEMNEDRPDETDED